MEGADAAIAATSSPGTKKLVVLYPLPGMDHLVSMIELGKILGAWGLTVTIVVIDPPYNTGALAPSSFAYIPFTIPTTPNSGSHPPSPYSHQVRVGTMAPPVDNATLLAKLEEMTKGIKETSLKQDETNRKIEGMQQSINRISYEQGEMKTWKPQLETKVTELQNSVTDLKLKEVVAFEVISISNPHLREILVAVDPGVLVVDFFCCIVLGVAWELSVPSYFFFTFGAEVAAFFLYLPVLHERLTVDFQDMGDKLVHVPGIPPFRAPHAMLPLMEREDAAYEGFLKVSTELCSTNGIIVNTFRWLERRAVETVAAGHCRPPGLQTPPLYCIGPLIKSEEVVGKGGKECLAWLDAQPKESVVSLCFGSIGRFSAKQIREVASGLEASGQRFLWVVRAPPSDDPAKKFEKPPEPDLDELLPERFLARTEDRGLVVKSWASQRDVLAHPSVGGFVTHCGWNSVLEAVPMLAWPLYAEQRLNRVFLEKELKLAVAVEGYDNDKELVAAEEVAAKVR
ncbi:unnamed protein product [Urochloa decumbens]|uniref:Glycosyltransferase n=1 Tax=Urochloa decumbens TaxID=240449 RepID=A0ABC9AM72_9POAL